MQVSVHLSRVSCPNRLLSLSEHAALEVKVEGELSALYVSFTAAHQDL